MARTRFQNAGVELFTDQDSIEHLANCGGVLSYALVAARDAAVAGATPLALSTVVEEVMRQRGATPVLLGLEVPGVARFPSAAAVCVNEIAVNGVPVERVLRHGDVVTIDAACELNGYITDAAVSLVIGCEKDELLDASLAMLLAMIESVRPGMRISRLSAAALACAESFGFDVADEALAHGVGRSLHAAPAVFWDSVEPDENAVLIPGMVLAAEPVAVASEGGRPGKIRRCRTERDGWSRRAPKRAAFEERTILVTEDGCRVLTPIPAGGPLGA